jgi:hypothetical protein
MAADAFDNILRVLRGKLPRLADLAVNPAHSRFTSAKIVAP